MIEKSDGTVIRSQERRLAHWIQQFRAQFSWSTATVGFSFVIASGPIQVDISPLSEFEAMNAIGF